MSLHNMPPTIHKKDYYASHLVHSQIECRLRYSVGQSTTCTMSRKEKPHKDQADAHMMSGIAMIIKLLCAGASRCDLPSGLIEQTAFPLWIGHIEAQGRGGHMPGQSTSCKH